MGSKQTKKCCVIRLCNESIKEDKEKMFKASRKHWEINEILLKGMINVKSSKNVVQTYRNSNK